MITSRVVLACLVVLFAGTGCALAAEWPNGLEREFPIADFSIAEVEWSEIRSGGPPRDGIPPLDAPRAVSIAEAAEDLAPTEPVIGLVIGGEARAYPLRVLIWHEIANDTLGGVPVAVTFCPLCNTAIVFDRRHDGQVLDFGTTGRLRNLDLVMYDRQTESWWQQFLGRAIIGTLTGAELRMILARLESFANFAARAPHGTVLVADYPRRYGDNPYAGYDSLSVPFHYNGAMPDGIAPLARVVRVGDQAWSLDLLRQAGEITAGDVKLSWSAGQNSALDAGYIPDGADVGNVLVTRSDGDSGWIDIAYSVDFAFAFSAFFPDGVIHLE
ncbi:MAG: DUF3179 domain-containing protein [Alphaproteobacteria bacterium]